MKKILTSFATLTLVSGAFTSTASWKWNDHKQKNINSQYQEKNSNYNLLNNSYLAHNDSAPSNIVKIYNLDNTSMLKTVVA